MPEEPKRYVFATAPAEPWPINTECETYVSRLDEFGEPKAYVERVTFPDGRVTIREYGDLS